MIKMMAWKAMRMIIMITLPHKAWSFITPTRGTPPVKPFTTTLSPITYTATGGVAADLRFHSRAPYLTKKTPTSLCAGIKLDGSALLQYFLQTLISYGVPTVATLIVIAFAASSFRGGSDGPRRRFDDESIFYEGDNAVKELYGDLYGNNADPGEFDSLPPFFSGFRRGQGKKLARNTGVPKKEYLEVIHLNEIYDSYKYTLTAAVDSKARAASQLRASNFPRALQKAVDATEKNSTLSSPLTPFQRTSLLKEEGSFLKDVGKMVAELEFVQREVTDISLLEEMEDMGVKVGQFDVEGLTLDMQEKENKTKSKNPFLKKMGSMMKGAELDEGLKALEIINSKIVKRELEFMRNVVNILGPERANGVRVALLGNGGGGLRQALTERPLLSLFTSSAEGESEDEDFVEDSNGQKRKVGRRVFVTNFPGDVTASQVSDLREEVTAILSRATSGVDEALVVLQTGGGTVTGYGLAAAQLMRLKEHQIRLTICVEQVAASGGYLMSCVADRIVASPFAVLGSIGVIGEVPNVYERLKTEGIEFQTVTAGKYKRTLTPTKKVTKEDIAKQKEDLEDILTLFKGFVAKNRPSLNIEDVATGETWFGEDALRMGLCDEIRTVDDVLAGYVQNEACQVYSVKYKPPKENVLESLGLPSGRQQRGLKGEQGIGFGLVRPLVQILVDALFPALREEILFELKRSSSSLLGNTRGNVADQYFMEDPRNVAENFRFKD